MPMRSDAKVNVNSLLHISAPNIGAIFIHFYSHNFFLNTFILLDDLKFLLEKFEKNLFENSKQSKLAIFTFLIQKIAKKI